MQYFPGAHNSHGFVSPVTIEENWKARFEFLQCEMSGESESESFIFPIVLHPDTSGMPHVIGMVDRMIAWLKQKGSAVEFVTYADCASRWKASCSQRDD